MLNNSLRANSGDVFARSAMCVLVATLAICGSVSALEKVIFETATLSGTSFELFDVRSDDERMGRQPSEIQVILGDEQFGPPPAKVVGSVLQNKLGDRLSGKTLKLSKFEVSIFAQRKWRSHTSGPSFGVLIPAIVDALGARTNIVCRVWVTIDGLDFEGLSFIDDVGGNKERALRQVVLDSMDALVKSIATRLMPAPNLPPERTH